MARSRSRLALVAMMAAAAAAVLLGTASAATYNVSWDLGTDYFTWASSKSFHPGDKLVFKYMPQAYDVVMVSKSGYDARSSANAIATYSSGNDIVRLPFPGTYYFICSVSGHCGAGMKVRIHIVPGANSLASAARTE